VSSVWLGSGSNESHIRRHVIERERRAAGVRVARVDQDAVGLGTCQHDCAGRSPGDGHGRVTLGADKNYDTRECVAQLRALQVAPHVAQNDTRPRSAIDAPLGTGALGLLRNKFCN
jgi:hypothetical protein